MSFIRSESGYTFGTESQAFFVSKTGKQYNIPGVPPKEYANPLGSSIDNFGPIARWGDNNLLPQEMAKDIQNTGVLSAAVDTKARIAMGSGPKLAKRIGRDKDGQDIIEFVDDPEVEDFLEANNAYLHGYSSTRDLFAMGNSFTQHVLTRDRKKIAGYKRQDPTECRLSIKSADTLVSEYVHMSGDWALYGIPNNPKLKENQNPHYASVPLLDVDFPYQDLIGRKTGTSFMQLIQYPTWNSHYYAPAPWYCAKEWVDISQDIPGMKDAMFNNQMTIKYIVSIHPKWWELFDPTYAGSDGPTQKRIQDTFYQQVEKYLVGKENAYKTLFSTKVLDNQTNELVEAVTITAIDDKIKDGKFIPDSAAADSQILFALSMNPALIGLSIPGSGTPVTGGSGSNIREAYLAQLMIIIAEQLMHNSVFNVVKKYNNWDARYCLRYPNMVLTTLNTGANTKPVA